MLGGGTFTSQNKKLPGAYINFASAQKASSTIGERGVAAMALELDIEKIREEEKYDGYYSIVTSELKMADEGFLNTSLTINTQQARS